MNILEKHRRLLKIQRIFLYCCGCEFIDIDFKFNFRTFSIAILLSTVFICVFNTIFFWPMNNALECLTAIGLAATGAVKFVVVLANQKTLYTMFEEIDDLYIKVQREGPLTRKYKILDDCTNLCLLLFKAYFVCWMLAIFVGLSYPGLMYYLKNELYYSLSLFIPFTDPFSPEGYVITTIYHLFCIALVFFGTLSADNIVIIVVAHYAMKVELFNVMIKELNEFLRITENNENNAEWSTKIEKYLNEIIEQHQQIISDVARLNEVFYYAIAVQISTAVFSMAIGLFLSVTTDWLVAYAVVLCSLYQLFVFSALGTVIEKKSDDIAMYIYEILWYLIPSKEKKKFQILLINAQRPLVIYIADLAELNVGTCVEILKKIYSFFMVMLEST